MRPDNFKKIKHVVVLMMENRSFDWMAGWLYAPSNKSPNGDPFEGLTGTESCPDASGKQVPVFHGTDVKAPLPDPGEEFDYVTNQIYGSPLAPMKGFVIDYSRAIKQHNQGRIFRSCTKPAAIMGCFRAESLPVLSALARNYAICDHWFCSVPSQTWPNRSFVHAATSSGMINNNKPGARIPTPNDTTTVFNVLESKGVNWAIYWDHEDIVGPLAWLAQDRLKGLRSHFFSMGRFIDDAGNGRLPAYSFIEPRFILDHNDQHPGRFTFPPTFAEKITKGEALMRKVYEAVRTSPQWNETMLVITYDEHGGCYDHVEPPKAVPPDGPGEQGFLFNRLGVRVPTLVISPYTQVGQVFRAPAGQNFDHTSIIKTVMELFYSGYNSATDSLTPRDQAAPDLSPALQLPENPVGPITNPRTDYPEIPTPEQSWEATNDPRARQLPLSEFQTSIVTAARLKMRGETALRAEATPPQLRTVDDALQHLRDLGPMLEEEAISQ
ncbi:MAG TPA: alkaline phosphatase family protein [Candidatus Saccharimonadales bacterium]|jgi:phospholipase C|nr:alkaline phosphatase family protein [Candidatus Saccharimonadales bacterium]